MNSDYNQLEENKLKPSVSRYLLRSFTFNELLINAVGLGHQIPLRRELLELLAGRPKLNVLFAELGSQKHTEGSFPICGREKH